MAPTPGLDRHVEGNKLLDLFLTEGVVIETCEWVERGHCVVERETARNPAIKTIFLFEQGGCSDRLFARVRRLVIFGAVAATCPMSGSGGDWSWWQLWRRTTLCLRARARLYGRFDLLYRGTICALAGGCSTARFQVVLGECDNPRAAEHDSVYGDHRDVPVVVHSSSPMSFSGNGRSGVRGSTATRRWVRSIDFRSWSGGKVGLNGVACPEGLVWRCGALSTSS